MAPRSGSAKPNPKKINHACLNNLNQFLSGELSFADWESRQEELESRLTPAPELPFAQAPARPRPVRPTGAPKAAA
ncbi:MAG: hypothetical protein HOC91_02790 [Nitrospinaceae bacterium]|jgi:hypothetical protein|nr:hypothetical protein [Nitrospinaceae bacterium]MBT3435322.1 hypothetical protein [Nitrospinaceae bacterium]MBT3820609.1 hypothetical protein [Nitrospinaceae bacterium]MBT4429420.1 hypothetical protein [Nitrospinaceae bacterium]MBT5366517.1 hypothetical protein [Nitrospinaceae bacterium]